MILGFRKRTADEAKKIAREKLAKLFAYNRQQMSQGTTFIGAVNPDTGKITKPNGQQYDGIPLGNVSQRVDGAVTVNSSQAVYVDEASRYSRFGKSTEPYILRLNVQFPVLSSVVSSVQLFQERLRDNEVREYNIEPLRNRMIGQSGLRFGASFSSDGRKIILYAVRQSNDQRVAVTAPNGYTQGGEILNEGGCTVVQPCCIPLGYASVSVQDVEAVEVSYLIIDAKSGRIDLDRPFIPITDTSQAGISPLMKNGSTFNGWTLPNQYIFFSDTSQFLKYRSGRVLGHKGKFLFGALSVRYQTYTERSASIGIYNVACSVERANLEVFNNQIRGQTEAGYYLTVFDLNGDDLSPETVLLLDPFFEGSGNYQVVDVFGGGDYVDWLIRETRTSDAVAQNVIVRTSLKGEFISATTMPSTDGLANEHFIVTKKLKLTGLDIFGNNASYSTRRWDVRNIALTDKAIRVETGSTNPDSPRPIGHAVAVDVFNFREGDDGTIIKTQIGKRVSYQTTIEWTANLNLNLSDREIDFVLK